MVRNHTQVNIRKVLPTYINNLNVEEEINSIVNKILMRIILAYSAINSKANPNLPYSILNPETSSDSPSAKSKGVRLVSAKHEINQITIIGINSRDLSQTILSFIIINKFIFALRARKNIKIRAKLTS